MTTVFVLYSVIFGIIIGQFITKWNYGSILIAKANPDSRTGLFLRGKMYYIITSEEYMTNILGIEDAEVVVIEAGDAQ